MVHGAHPMVAPPAGFEPALPPPEGGALSPELRGPSLFGSVVALTLIGCRAAAGTTLAGFQGAWSRTGGALSATDSTLTRGQDRGSQNSPRLGAVFGSIGRRSVLRLGVLTLASGAVVSATGGCVSPAAAEPAVIRTTAPPWDAPRDAVSYIDQAGLPQLPLNDTSDPQVFRLTVTVAGAAVTVPANIGVDRVRALQAPVHTHENDGQVWLEGQGNRTVTLGEFFTLWGVRLDESCLGERCGTPRLVVDGQDRPGDPRSLVLRSVQRRVELSIG